VSAHQFDPEVAAQVGVNAAVIYQNIAFWCEKDRVNGKKIFDGRAWTYNSTKAYSEQFWYLTPDQIRRALEKLESAGLIAVGCFNKDPRDRTKWYCDLRQPHLAEMPAPFGENPRPLPDSKPDNKPDIAPSSPNGDQVVQLFPKQELEERKPKAAPKRKAEFPDGWTPDSKLSAWAKAKGFTDQQISHMAETCIYYHRSKGNEFLDFNAAFRTWVLKEAKSGGDRFARPAFTQPQTGPSLDGIRRRISERYGDPK
jgi:hypothetical protein